MTHAELSAQYERSNISYQQAEERINNLIHDKVCLNTRVARLQGVNDALAHELSEMRDKVHELHRQLSEALEPH